MRKLIIGLFIAVLLWSCGNNTKQENDQKKTKEDSVQSSQKGHKIEVVNPGDTLVIEAKNVNMRTQPKIGDNVITQLDSGDVTRIIKRGKKEKIGDMVDYWYKVRYKNREMWVFGALSSMEAENLELSGDTENLDKETPDNVIVGTFEKIVNQEDAEYFVMKDRNGNKQKLRIVKGYEGEEMFSSHPEDMQGLKIKIIRAREEIKRDSTGRKMEVSRIKKVEMRE